MRQHLRRRAPLENSSADVEPLPARAGGALRYGALAARYPSDESYADGKAFAGGRTNHAGSRRSGGPAPARRSNDAERPLAFVCDHGFGTIHCHAREDLLSGQLVRVLPQWNAKDLPIHVVYVGARLLPTRVRAFIDFAVSYMTKEFGSNA